MKLKRMAKSVLEMCLDAKAYVTTKRRKTRQKTIQLSENTPIKTLFICQMPSLWAKLKPVYEAMEASADFSPEILAVPENIKEFKENKCYDFFIKQYTNVINAVTPNGWYGLPSKEYEYIFYQRPYDIHLPKFYRSARISKYGSICYIAYGFLLTKTNEKICMAKHFFRNVYIFFAENEYVKNINTEMFPKSHSKGLKKSIYVGYPALMDMQMAREQTGRKVGFLQQVVWTPRWTTNENVGKSNFFAFKDKMMEYFKENPECSLVFRPHPLMFNNFLKTGEMTGQQIEELKGIFAKSSNMQINSEAEYFDLFWKSDILVTDISSVIIEFLLTEKPIIYCESKVEPNDFMKEILNVCYQVSDWSGIEKYLGMLRNGQDPLLQSRTLLAKRFATENDLQTPTRIIQFIKKDRGQR